MDIRDALERCIRTVPDFPIPGIQFRDITPVLADPGLMKRIAESFAEAVAETNQRPSRDRRPGASSSAPSWQHS